MIDLLYVASEADQAWAAGLFEGEGSLCWQLTGGRKYPRVYLSTTDPDVLRRFVSIIGVGRIYEVRGKRPANWKPIEAWVACGIEDVRHVAEIIGAHLGERRSKRLAELLAWEPAEAPPRRNYCVEPIVSSRAGYLAHRANGEASCDRCRLSSNLYMRNRRRELGH